MSLTIKGLSDMAFGTATANGWHNRKGEVLTPDHAIVQLAAATMVLRPWLATFEETRKKGISFPDALPTFEREVIQLSEDGLTARAEELLEELGEAGAPVEGSRTQAIAWMGLAITELVEAVEAVINRDKDNFAEELGDVMIRLGDNQGAINDMPGHPLGPIDLEAAILAKNERNKQRGYRHGGKLA